MSKKDIHTGSHAHENQKGNTIDGKHIIDNRTDNTIDGKHIIDNRTDNTIDGKHIIDSRTDISSNLSAENESKTEKDMSTEKKLKRASKLERKEYFRKLNEPPKLTVLEEVGNAVSHGVGAGLSIAGFILLLLKSDTGLKVMATCFYGISLILMFLMSCLYHSYASGLTVKRIWRRFDYTSIYLLIGGTFAPLFLVYWGNTVGIVFFCIQWGLIVAGITIICVFGPGRFRPVHYTLYFVIGWSAIMFMPGWFKHDKPLLIMILIGGIIYTVGMIPFVRDKKGDHFIWHLFVLAGAAFHFFAIYFLVY